MMGENIGPKHVQLTWNNKLIYTVHLVGYFHSCITMHGFMNVKLTTHLCLVPRFLLDLYLRFLHKFSWTIFL